MARISLLQIRRDTAANWASANPTLALGEPGYDTTNKTLKIGDGTTAWNSLAPHQGSVAGQSSPSSLDNQIVRFDGTTGLVIQNALVTIDDSGSITVPSGQSVLAPTFDTNVAAAAVTLSGTTLAADGTDSNIDINITPKGSGEVNLPKVDINAGTIDGATIATSDITVGSGKTLDVSAGTLTLAAGQIAGAKVTGPVSIVVPIATKTSSSTGTAGMMAADADYLYVCVATDTWIRIAKTAW